MREGGGPDDGKERADGLHGNCDAVGRCRTVNFLASHMLKMRLGVLRAPFTSYHDQLKPLKAQTHGATVEHVSARMPTAQSPNNPPDTPNSDGDWMFVVGIAQRFRPCGLLRRLPGRYSSKNCEGHLSSSVTE